MKQIESGDQNWSVCRARPRAQLSTILGAALAVTAGFSAQVHAAETIPAEQVVVEKSGDGVAPGYIVLSGLFAEGSYIEVEDKSSFPTSRKLESYGARAGAVYALPKLGMFAIPSITFAKSSTDGSNPFATVDSDADIWGGELKLVYVAGSNLLLHTGASTSKGKQELVFNGVVNSTTNLQSFAGYFGGTMTVYKSPAFAVSVFDEIRYDYLHADFDPTNTVDEGSSRVWSNELALQGAWQVADGTQLRASAAWVGLIYADELIGEDKLDRNFGILSLGATQRLWDSVSLYGSVDKPVLDSHRKTISAKIGIMTVF